MGQTGGNPPPPPPAILCAHIARLPAPPSLELLEEELLEEELLEEELLELDELLEEELLELDELLESLDELDEDEPNGLRELPIVMSPWGVLEMYHAQRPARQDLLRGSLPY